jgi:Ca2+-binding RTX toxin-like protein
MPGSPPAPAEAAARIAAAVARRQQDLLEAWNPWAHAKVRVRTGGERNDRLEGGEGPDDIQGRGGDDTIHGRGADDVLRGGRGADLIYGEDGADWIEGGRGDDTLVGGRGADTFSAFEGAGLDLVLDFSAQQGDRVELAPDLAFTVRQEGADTVIAFAGGRMVLRGVRADTLPKGAIRNRRSSLAPGG